MLVLQIFFQWAGGKSANAVMSVAASSSMILTLGNCRAEHVSLHVQLGADGLGGGLREEGADGCHHPLS